jgi:hypothetical protein
MLRFDAQQKSEHFARETQTCPICFSEVPGSACVRLPCSHIACEACFGQHARIRISDGDLLIRCPSCAEPAPLDMLRASLGGPFYYLFSLYKSLI